MNSTTSYQSLMSRFAPDEPLDLESWRNWLARAMIILGAIGLPMGMLATLPVLIGQERYGIIALDAALWFYLLAMAIIGRRSSKANAYVFLAGIYALTISYFVIFGPIHARPAWLVLCAVMAGMFLGIRPAVLSVVLNAAILMLLYVLMGPENPAWASEYAAPFTRWIMFVVNVSIITLVSSVPVGFMLNRLDRALQVQRVAHQEFLAESEKLQAAYSSLKVEIEQREKAEKALIQSEEKYRLLAENATDVIWTADMNLNMTYVSPSVRRVRGFTVEEILSQRPEDQLTPESLALAIRVLSEELEREGSGGEDLFRARTIEVESRCKDGSTTWSETKLDFVRDSDGKPVGVLGVSRDISDRKRSEEELANTQSLLLASIEQTAAGIIIADAPDVRIRLANSAALGIRGAASVDLTEIPMELHPEHWQTYHPAGTPFEPQELPLSQAVLLGKTSKNVEMIIQSGGAEDRWVSANAAPVRNREGEIVAGVVVFSDVSELKQAEEEKKELEIQLLQAQKMEAMGTLAGGIAHDFNNILSGIIGYTELSQMSVPKGSGASHYLGNILRAGERAKDLVQQILTFSRQTEQKLRPVSVHIIVREALKLLRASLPSTIEIRQNIASDLLVMGDPTQIHQILMNLCANAGHAMQEGGGVLEVDLRNVELDSDSASRHPDLVIGPYLILTVGDDGHGMPPKVMERIFDPFFTTKERGEGTGMGLAVVHGIVKSYGGAIHAHSEPGKGSRFQIFLPAIAGGLEPDEAVEEILPKGTERILFVDDESALTEIGEEMLESLGYEVVTKTNSLEALDLFREQPERFDLVITDMTMPQMNGDKLARELLAIRRDLPIVLCTGFSRRITEAKAKEMGIRRLLMKPLLLRDLAHNVRAVLDGE